MKRSRSSRSSRCPQERELVAKAPRGDIDVLDRVHPWSLPAPTCQQAARLVTDDPVFVDYDVEVRRAR